MQRQIRPELLDQASDAEAHANLADLERIHRWFGGHSAAISALRRVIRPEEKTTILDMGSAFGPLSRSLAHVFPAASVINLDHRLRNLRGAPPPRVAADAFDPPFPDRSFDVVYCSLLLHHFEAADIVRLLRRMRQLARRAVVVVDLHRHRIARGFLPWTRWALRWKRITLHDGPVSVEAAFTPDELKSLASCAGLHGAVVRRHLPWFRLSLVYDTTS
jgi:SAM-dependent methyltransferase